MRVAQTRPPPRRQLGPNRSTNGKSASLMRHGIVFIAPGDGAQGGIATVVANYERTRFWVDHDCHIFAATRSFDSKLIQLVDDLSRWIRFTVSLLIGKRYRVASIHTGQGASFYRKLAYVVICRLFKIPVVLHVHPARFVQFCNEGSAFRRLAVSLAARLTDQIVVLSESIRVDLARVVDGEKIAVLGNPVDIDMYASCPRTPRTARPRILFVGWIIPEKGVYDLVDAMPAVLEKFPDAVFTFAGNKEVERLKAMLAERGLQESSEVLGWVEGRTKLQLFRTSWLLVLPSYTEGLPNVILEAMASELPVVTTPVGGIPSVLSDEKTAIFVEPGNTRQISDAIIRLIQDQELSKSLARKAYWHACENYSVDAIERGLLQIYARYFTKHPP
jgi:glycosyltransferase involved in cell wall biosynthesis